VAAPVPAAPAPTRAEAPAKPAVLALEVQPAAIQAGQSAMLRWEVANATRIRIEPDLGAVDSAGTRELSPAQSIAYKLIASGPGGEVSAVAKLDVVPAAVSSAPAASRLTLEQAAQQLEDVFFDLNGFNVREDARLALQKNAAFLKEFLTGTTPITIRIEGHADERGSAEYNYVISARRAEVSREYLVTFGIEAAKLSPVGYGKEMPVCTESTEDCWQRNRRVHFVPVVEERSLLTAPNR
jgi:peptidoglycan-associated lipoprotein